MSGEDCDNQCKLDIPGLVGDLLPSTFSLSSNANACRNLSAVSGSTVVSGVSNMLKNPNSPLTDALPASRLFDDEVRDDTTSVTAGIVAACSMFGRAPVAGAPNREVREGTRSQDGMEGSPTDHPLPPEGCAEGDATLRMSAFDAVVDGG